MAVRRSTTVWAACAAAAFSAVFAAQTPAQDRPSNSDQELGILLARPLDSADATGDVTRPPARRPLMSLMDNLGVGKSLDDLRLDVYGHIQGSYTYNTDDPESDFNVGRVFDFEHDRALLNQLDLNIERRVDLDSGNVDVGGRIEMLYGTDSRFIHANGMFDDNDFFDGPDLQFDIPQVYVDVAVPVGEGLRIRAGKFLFFKQIDPNASVFYSHSYTFGAALPFTLTGVTGYYEFTDRFSFETGVVRGWDDALEDDNDTVSFLGRARYRASDELTFSLAAITGPEQIDDNNDYRTALNFVASYQVNSQLTLLLDSIYGYDSNTPLEGASDWYGVAVYGIYKFNDYLSAAARLEYYRDDEGATTGIAGAGPFFGFSSQSLYEVTAGVTITPFANDEIGRNFKVRPEIRYDYSDEDYFDGFTEDSQLTLAVDAIFNF